MAIYSFKGRNVFFVCGMLELVAQGCGWGFMPGDLQSQAWQSSKQPDLVEFTAGRELDWMTFGDAFQLYDVLILVCCCLWSPVHSAHLLHSNNHSGAGFPFPSKLLPKLYISCKHSQDGKFAFLLQGGDVRRLLLQQHLHGLVVSWSGGVDSGLNVMRADFNARHCFLHMVYT